MTGECPWLLPQSPERNPQEGPHCAQGWQSYSRATKGGTGTGSVGEAQAEDEHRLPALLTGGKAGMHRGFRKSYGLALPDRYHSPK